MIEPTPLTRRRMTDQLDQLEQEIGTQIDRELPMATDNEKLDQLGRMSAEAVLKQYEAAAKAFEVMGEEVKDRIANLQRSLEEADASMKLLTEAAAAIREKGKLAHAQIEDMSSVSKLIREMCEGVTKKISGMMARAFTNPNFGTQARVEVWGREVRLTFVASTTEKAESLAENIVNQLKAGAINITLMGKPTSIVEE